MNLNFHPARFKSCFGMSPDAFRKLFELIEPLAFPVTFYLLLRSSRVQYMDIVRYILQIVCSTHTHHRASLKLNQRKIPNRVQNYTRKRTMSQTYCSTLAINIDLAMHVATSLQQAHIVLLRCENIHRFLRELIKLSVASCSFPIAPVCGRP